ncbi:hypothetical protein [Planktothrix sp. FACHB-1365]|uniref:hypothetical protein n=1 Tax=Planktothrix sp. FACHB-1365 TaxID=2692855 RepID=UPI001683F5E3|nr:hypothetical protein [Planktothrix sp. FACHB-1365]MBD2483199.1 hypothetical protein [Planktothrix sp. FACHB-1365]
MISQFGKNKFLSMLLLATAVFSPGISLISSKATAQPGLVTIKLVNGTDKGIKLLFVVPTDAPNLENEVLGADVLNPSESRTVKINNGSEECNYNFRAIFDDGTESVTNQGRVCDGEEYIYKE